MYIFLAVKGARMRRALRLLLEQQPGLVLAGEVASAAELSGRLRVACPDLLLIDWALLERTATNPLSSLRRYCPRLLVVALVGALKQPLPDGVDAIASIADPPDRLLDTILALRPAALSDKGLRSQDC